MLRTHQPAPRRARSLSTLGLLLALATPIVAQALPAPGRHAVIDVTVVDVAASTLRAHQTVLVDGEHLARVGSTAEVAVPEGFAAIDGRGLFLLPGLFDSHVHLADPDTFAPLLVANGVVFAREMGSATDVGLQLRRELAAGERLGPELIVCGAIVDGRPPVWPFSETCETPDEARAVVERLADAGVDQIKLYSLLRADVYHAAIAAAKARGLTPVGHIPMEVGLDAALAAGQATCEHLTGFDVKLGQLAGHAIQLDRRQAFGMHRHWADYEKLERAQIDALCRSVQEAGMRVCPTLIVMDRIGHMADAATKEDPRLQYVSAGMRAFWDSARYNAAMAAGVRAALPFQHKLVKDMHAAGVTLLCGTDLANPYVIAGFALHDEMALLQAAGIAAGEVLKTAITHPARFFGVADRLGAIDAGKTASMLLVAADPLHDVNNVRDVRGVFLRGRWYDRAGLDAMLAEVRDRALGVVPASDPSPKDALRLPGEVVARGGYASSFNGQPSEREEFLITKSDAGYQVASRVTPLSTFSQASHTELTYGPDLGFRHGTYRTHAKQVVSARYELRDGKLVGNATRDDAALPESALDVAADTIVAGPGSAFEFAVYSRVPLAVDEEKVYTSAGFGYPDWKPAATQVRCKRLADTTLELNGVQHAARHYEVSFKTPMGEFRGESWVDGDHVLLKTRMRMPFGTIETVRTPE